MAITTKGTYELYKCTNSIKTFVAPYNGLYKIYAAGGRNGGISGSSKVSCAYQLDQDLLFTRHATGTLDKTLDQYACRIMINYAVLKKGDKLYINVGGDGGASTYGERDGVDTYLNTKPPSIITSGKGGYNGGKNAGTEFVDLGDTDTWIGDRDIQRKSPSYKFEGSSGGVTTVATFLAGSSGSFSEYRSASDQSGILIFAQGEAKGSIRYGVSSSGTLSTDLFINNAFVSNYPNDMPDGFFGNDSVVYKKKAYSASRYTNETAVPFSWDGKAFACIQLVDRDFPIYCGDSEIYKVCLGDSEIIDLKL